MDLVKFAVCEDTIKASGQTYVEICLGPYPELSEANEQGFGNMMIGVVSSTFDVDKEKSEMKLIVDGEAMEFQFGFGPPNRYSGAVVGTQPPKAETELTNAHQLSGAFAVAHRGGSTFTNKMLLAQAAGAVGLIIVNDDDDLSFKPNPVPTDGCPTGVGDIPVLLIRSGDSDRLLKSKEISFNDLEVETNAWMYLPVRGVACTTTSQMAVSWVEDDDWWRSGGSILAGDRLGLWYNVEACCVDVFINGELLGTVHSGLDGPENLCWAVACGPLCGPLHVWSANVSKMDTASLASLPRTESLASVSEVADCRMRVLSSLLTGLNQPAVLKQLLSASVKTNSELDLEAFTGSICDELVSCVGSWANRVPPEPVATPDGRLKSYEDHWVWGESHSSFDISADKKKASRRSGRRPDYAAVLGSKAMRTGIHEWTLQIDRDHTGVCLGVCTSKLPLASESALNEVTSDKARVWMWDNRSTTLWQNYGRKGQRHRIDGFARGSQIRLKLDCDKGRLEFFSPASQSVPNGHLDMVEADAGVYPFVWFDYESVAVIVKTVFTDRLKSPKETSDATQIHSQCADLLCLALHLSFEDAEHSEDAKLAIMPAHECKLKAIIVKKLFAAAGDILRCIQQAATSDDRARMMQKVHDPVHANPAGLATIGDTTIDQVTTCREWPYLALKASNLHGLLGAAISTAKELIPRRVDGMSCAAMFLDPLTLFLSRVQEAYDLVPELMMDQNARVRRSARDFAAEHGCTLATAEFYIWSFGGLDGDNKAQAVQEYEAAGKREAPRGFRMPTGSTAASNWEDRPHWLAHRADAVAGLGGRCVASLCAGLKHEEPFDTSLFTSRQNNQRTEELRAFIDLPEFSSIPRNWVGLPAPELTQIEHLTILAMLLHSGALDAADQESVPLQGLLLYCGLQALKVKNFVQNTRRQQAAASGQPPSWEIVATPFLQRADLLLHYGSTAATAATAAAAEYKLPVLEATDAVWEWQPLGESAKDRRCVTVDHVLHFIQNGPTVSTVHEILEAREKAVAEATVGYAGGLQLLQAGVEHTSDNIKRVPTLPRASSGQPNSAKATCSGTWMVSAGAHDTARGIVGEYELVERDGHIFGRAYVPWLATVNGMITDEGDGHRRSAMLVVSAAVAPAGTSRPGPCTRSRLSMKFVGLEARCTGTGYLISNPDNTWGVTGTLISEGATAIPWPASDGSNVPCTYQRGISVTKRRAGLLQSIVQAFKELGPLAEHKVQTYSDSLCLFVLHLLASDPSAEVKYWAACFLLTRLDESTAACLAADSLMRSVVQSTIRVPESVFSAATIVHSIGNAYTAQATLVGAVINRLATSAAVDEMLLQATIDMVHNEITECDVSTVAASQLEPVLKGVLQSCVNPAVKQLLRQDQWQTLMWYIVESMSQDKQMVRLPALALLCATLDASEANLLRLLNLVTLSSAEPFSEPRMLGAHTLRANVVLLLRHLVSRDTAWTSLFDAAFITCVQEAVGAVPEESDVIATRMWPFILVCGGMLEVCGLEQPGHLEDSAGQRTSNVMPVARRLLPDVLAFIETNVVAHPSSLRIHVLRTRVLKMAFELAVIDAQLTTQSLEKIAQLSRCPIKLPEHVTTIEQLIAKVRSLSCSRGKLSLHDCSEEEPSPAPYAVSNVGPPRPPIKTEQRSSVPEIALHPSLNKHLIDNLNILIRNAESASTADPNGLIETALKNVFKPMQYRRGHDEAVGSPSSEDDAVLNRTQFGELRGYEILHPFLAKDAPAAAFFQAVKICAQTCIKVSVNKDRIRAAGLFPLFGRYLLWPSSVEPWQPTQPGDPTMKKLLLESASALGNSVNGCSENKVIAGKLGYIPPIFRILVDYPEDRAENDGIRRKAILALKQMCVVECLPNCARFLVVDGALQTVSELGRPERSRTGLRDGQKYVLDAARHLLRALTNAKQDFHFHSVMSEVSAGSTTPTLDSAGPDTSNSSMTVQPKPEELLMSLKPLSGGRGLKYITTDSIAEALVKTEQVLAHIFAALCVTVCLRDHIEAPLDPECVCNSLKLQLFSAQSEGPSKLFCTRDARSLLPDEEQLDETFGRWLRHEPSRVGGIMGVIMSLLRQIELASNTPALESQPLHSELQSNIRFMRWLLLHSTRIDSPCQGSDDFVVLTRQLIQLWKVVPESLRPDIIDCVARMLPQVIDAALNDESRMLLVQTCAEQWELDHQRVRLSKTLLCSSYLQSLFEVAFMKDRRCLELMSTLNEAPQVAVLRFKMVGSHGGVNVRRTPSIDGDILGIVAYKLFEDDTVEVSCIEDGWIKLAPSCYASLETGPKFQVHDPIVEGWCSVYSQGTANFVQCSVSEAQMAPAGWSGRCSPSITLSDSGRVATHESGGAGYASAMTAPINPQDCRRYIELQVLNADRQCFVGVFDAAGWEQLVRKDLRDAAAEADAAGASTATGDIWTYAAVTYCFDGEVRTRQGPVDGWRSYGPRWTTGDDLAVGISWSQSGDGSARKATVTFYKDGVDLGVACDNLSGPLMIFWQSNNAVVPPCAARILDAQERVGADTVLEVADRPTVSAPTRATGYISGARRTSPPAAEVTVDPGIAAALAEMGFSGGQVRAAALATGNRDVEAAVMWCLAHGSDVAEDGDDGADQLGEQEVVSTVADSPSPGLEQPPTAQAGEVVELRAAAPDATPAAVPELASEPEPQPEPEPQLEPEPELEPEVETEPEPEPEPEPAQALEAEETADLQPVLDTTISATATLETPEQQPSSCPETVVESEAAPTQPVLSADDLMCEDGFRFEVSAEFAEGPHGLVFAHRFEGICQIQTINAGSQASTLPLLCEGMMLVRAQVDGEEEIVCKGMAFESVMGSSFWQRWPLTLTFEHPWQREVLSSDTPYYFNHATGESMWDRPPEVNAVLDAMLRRRNMGTEQAHDSGTQRGGGGSVSREFQEATKAYTAAIQLLDSDLSIPDMKWWNENLPSWKQLPSIGEEITNQCLVSDASSHTRGHSPGNALHSANVSVREMPYWQSNGNAPSASSPHWIVITLPQPMIGVKLQYTPHSFSGNSFKPRRVQLRVAHAEDDSFHDHGSAIPLAKTGEAVTLLDSGPTVMVQRIKLEVIVNYDGGCDCQIGTLKVFGDKKPGQEDEDESFLDW
jgi:hypothetical protein